MADCTASPCAAITELADFAELADFTELTKHTEKVRTNVKSLNSQKRGPAPGQPSFIH